MAQLQCPNGCGTMSTIRQGIIGVCRKCGLSIGVGR